MPNHQTSFGALETKRAQMGIKPFALDKETPRSTMAMVEIEGQRFYGVNSSNDPASLPLRREVLGRVQNDLGLMKNWKLNKAQAMTHAEGHALMEAEKALGKLPSKVTLYVDRKTCTMCSSENGLQSLADLFKIEELTVIDPSGRIFIFKGIF